MRWTVVSTLTKEADGSDWLMPFVPKTRHQFECILHQDDPLSGNWHNRASAKTDFKEWRSLWSHGSKGFKTAQKNQTGIITTFPQLAAIVGLQQRLSIKHIPVVAWWFNVNPYSGVKGWIACQSLQSIDRFVVHTRIERELYSQWLKIPLDRFEFVPLQMGHIPITHQEETEKPFIVAAGSAMRDFPLLFEAVKRLNIRTIVISGPRALAGLELPPQVEAPFGLPRDEIRRIVQQARISVIPCIPSQPAPGIVTALEAMRLYRPVVATRITGIDDYVTDGETGLFVEPHSLDDLTEAIDRLWNDPELRKRLGEQAGLRAEQYYSDEAAGVNMACVLDRVEDERLL